MSPQAARKSVVHISSGLRPDHSGDVHAEEAPVSIGPCWSCTVDRTSDRRCTASELAPLPSALPAEAVPPGSGDQGFAAQSMPGLGELELSRQGGLYHRRVVGVHREGYAGGGELLVIRFEADARIARRAHAKAYMTFCEQSQNVRITGRRHSVGHASCAKDLDRLSHDMRSAHLPCVRHEPQPCAPCAIDERTDRCRRDGLIADEADPDHPLRGRRDVQYPFVLHHRRPADHLDEPRDLDPELLLSSTPATDDAVEPGVPGVQARIEADLGVGDVLLGH